MSSWNRTGPIVVEVDGSAKNLHVVDYAVDEAVRSGADLALVAPYPVGGAYSPTFAAELADDGIRRALAHIRHRYGPAVDPAAGTARGARLRILAQAALNARMLVVGRPRARGPRRLMNAVGHLALAADTGCPVVVVPMAWEPSPADRRIAVGVDGTALSTEALEFAFGAAAARRADLLVVHAGLRAARAWNDADPDDAWISRADQVLSEALTPWLSLFPEVRVTRLLSSRRPAAALVRESAEAGLVVVGVHSGTAPIDAVVRRSLASMTSPVAIVPQHPIEVEREQLQSRYAEQRLEFVAPAS